MTAGWTRLPYDVLARISTRITNSVPRLTVWFWMLPPSRRQPLSGSDAHTELSSQTDSPGLVPDSWDEAGALLL